MSTLSVLAQNFEEKTFGEMMAALRMRTGMSARGLSMKAGLSASYVSKVETDRFLPTLDHFAAIVRQLNVTDAEIVFLIRML